MKSAVAIRHVHFETLGTFEEVLARSHYSLEYFDIGAADLNISNFPDADLLVVLGGPVSVYDNELYPFIDVEKELIARRLSNGRPILGICLGAQLIASALGSNVFSSGAKEIGFAKLSLTDAGLSGPLRHLKDVHVLHWHGDTFDLPRGSSLLASTALCENQAFSIGTNVLGVQFHPEADASAGLEPWLIGHAAELFAAKIDPREIRKDAQRYGGELSEAGRRMFSEWLSQLS